MTIVQIVVAVLYCKINWVYPQKSPQMWIPQTNSNIQCVHGDATGKVLPPLTQVQTSGSLPGRIHLTAGHMSHCCKLATNGQSCFKYHVSQGKVVFRSNVQSSSLGCFCRDASRIMLHQVSFTEFKLSAHHGKKYFYITFIFWRMAGHFKYIVTSPTRREIQLCKKKSQAVISATQQIIRDFEKPTGCFEAVLTSALLGTVRATRTKWLTAVKVRRPSNP